MIRSKRQQSEERNASASSVEYRPPDFGSNGANAPLASEIESDTPYLDALGVELPEVASTGGWDSCPEQASTSLLPATSPALDPTQAIFAAQIFKRENHRPSTGCGMFDVRYAPASGEIVATLNLEVAFDLPQEMPWTERPWPWQDEDGWTDAEKEQYVHDMKSTIEQGWNSAPHPIRCTKPGWEQFVALPRIEVNAFAAGEGSLSPHYRVTVCKAGRPTLGSSRPEVHDPSFGRPGRLGIDEAHLNDTSNTKDTVLAELHRIQQALPTVRFDKGPDGAWALTAEGRAKVGRFAEVVNDAMPSMHRPGLVTDGWDRSEEADNRTCGEILRAELAGRNVQNEISVTGGGINDRGVMGIQIARRDLDVELWPHPAFNMVQHEVGHMLGLFDEYSYADDEGHAMPAAQRELLDASGVDQHPIDADTTSVMSHGKDVMPAHYVTLWEAIGLMTSAFLKPTDWKL